MQHGNDSFFRSVLTQSPSSAHRRALARPADHDLRHGLEVGRGRVRQGRHLPHVDRDAPLPVAARARVPRQGRNRRARHEARREPRCCPRRGPRVRTEGAGRARACAELQGLSGRAGGAAARDRDAGPAEGVLG